MSQRLPYIRQRWYATGRYTGNLVGKFIQHVLPGVMRPLRVLWNEIIAFVFIVLAIPALMQGFHTWRKFDGSSDQLFRLIIISVFSFVMLGFGVSSYLRARRISRS